MNREEFFEKWINYCHGKTRADCIKVDDCAVCIAEQRIKVIDDLDSVIKQEGYISKDEVGKLIARKMQNKLYTAREAYEIATRCLPYPAFEKPNRMLLAITDDLHKAFGLGEGK